jgi:hypothetical protein
MKQIIDLTFKRSVCLLGSLFAISLCLSYAHSKEIPYLEALNRAKVELQDLSHISQKGLIVGNGELNAIVYSSGNEIRLRLSKNDCWDMRIETKDNAPLPTVNVAEQTFTGEQGKGQPSWEQYVHPTALPCADVCLTAAKDQISWKSAKLDLAKAIVTVTSDVDSTQVRVLSQQNVVLIESDRDLQLNGISNIVQDHDGKPISGWVNQATQKEHLRFRCLHQKIAGNQDVSGMDIYLVAGRKGNRHAIAVVTSRESNHPFEEAIRLTSMTLKDHDAIKNHETSWKTFWSRSGVKIGDLTLQNWWYRMVYFMRTFARPGGNVIGLQAAMDQLGGWHNSLTLNYNAQQTYLTAGPINHPELIEPFINVLTRNLNRAKWYARTSFPGSEGAYFAVNLWPFEPDPAQCKSHNKHQHAYMPWGYSWGTAGHSASVLWDYYQYQPTKQRLQRIWPILEQFALFYCSLLDQCPMVDGKRKVGPTYFAEIGDFGVFNSTYDLVFIKFTLQITQTAAMQMGNSQLAQRCASHLATLPAYPLELDPSQKDTVIGQWLGGGLPKYMNIGSEIMSLFPTNEVTWMSDSVTKDLLHRTINHSEKVTHHINSNVAMNIARARLGRGAEAISNAKRCFGINSDISAEQPNGLFYWKIHGYYLSEQVCIARMVSELLLQSAGNVIRLFPAWPLGQDAQFQRLLAQGGFEVSADRVANEVQNVMITSTLGGEICLENPWQATDLIVITRSNQRKVTTIRTHQGWKFLTSPGESYYIKPNVIK